MMENYILHAASKLSKVQRKCLISIVSHDPAGLILTGGLAAIVLM